MRLLGVHLPGPASLIVRTLEVTVEPRPGPLPTLGLELQPKGKEAGLILPSHREPGASGGFGADIMLKRMR